MLEEIAKDTSALYEYLCCPRCKQDLRSSEVISCSSCGEHYGFQDGIPILVDLGSLPDHLSHQIKYFENEPISNTEYHIEAWQESYIERFNNNFTDVKNKVVVDCGTGSGYMAIELARQGAFVIACDLTLKSLVRLKLAAKNLGVDHRILIVCCSAEKLPFKDKIADYFISNAVLEHLPNEKESIEEISRVCKKEAGIMIAVPLAYKYLNPLMLPLNYVHDKRIGHLRRYDEKNILLKFPHFILIRSYYTGHFGKVFMTLCNLIVLTFNRRYIESVDRKKITNKWWASNIVCFLKRV